MLKPLNVYEARAIGRTYCQTEGSDHYKEGGVEPLDLMIAKGIIEDFCIGNMVKYATRFKKTRNPEDLKKVSDYAQILCGVELHKKELIKHDQEAKANDTVYIQSLRRGSDPTDIDRSVSRSCERSVRERTGDNAEARRTSD